MFRRMRGRQSDQRMIDEQVIDTRVHELLSLFTAGSTPNVHHLRLVANAIEPLAFNIKQMGYTLARQLADALPPPGPSEARRVNLPNSLSTQAAIESDWARHWCNELKIPVVYHRKIWELAFVMQSVHDHGHIRPGARGLGFGCGQESLPSYFAGHDMTIVATDLPPQSAAEAGWVHTGQHTSAIEQCFMPHLVDRARFDRNVAMRFVDMNDIPDDLTDFDFCWSICALEHLGSIDRGLAFIENSLKTLRPGGLSVHTTEFNIRDDGGTVDNWSTVAFQRRHMERITARLRAQGHRVAPFDYSLGDGPLDRFVDLPPFVQDLPENISKWLGDPVHIKLAMDGLVVTCIGIAVEKAAH